MQPSRTADLLIIGAGPFGLALAASAAAAGVQHLIVGQPMQFWQSHMPAGMLLRSGSDWHLDPLDVDTIDAYLQTVQPAPARGQPLSLDVYLGYAAWFQERKNIRPVRARIERLDWDPQPGGYFAAKTDAGDTLLARSVALAVGFEYFKLVPEDLAVLLPAGRYQHTCDAVELPRYRGKRVLIIGGRQSAFEWAALLHEAGAAGVDLAYRHETPAFTESDWSWVTPLVERMAEEPGWFRSLSAEEQEELRHRFWIEGRAKLEPWLQPRLAHETIRLRPRTQLAAAEVREDGALLITFAGGEQIVVDSVILATGYQVDMTRVPFLSAGNILQHLELQNGYPVLTDHFQASIPGLYITSLAATQGFGPFFGFTVSVRTAAKLIVADLARTGLLV